MAGHDINYVAISGNLMHFNVYKHKIMSSLYLNLFLSGLLTLIGRKETNPLPPQNMLADFAGGGLICAMGIVMALFEREKSKLGQVIDASMAEGAAYVGSWVFKSQDMPIWTGKRGDNWLLSYLYTLSLF